MPITVSSFLVPKNDGTFPLLEDKHLIGGFRVVANSAARDALDPLCKKDGMIVATADNGKWWRYDSNTSSYIEFTVSPATASASTLGVIRVGSGLSIDGNGILSANAQVSDGFFLDLGNVSGAVSINVASAKAQRFTPTANTTLTFTNWPAVGFVGELLLQVVNAGSKLDGVTAVNWILPDGTTTSNFSNTGVTLQSSGIDFLTLWTLNGGSTVYGKVIR
jgi:hypothetical protein